MLRRINKCIHRGIFNKPNKPETKYKKVKFYDMDLDELYDFQDEYIIDQRRPLEIAEKQKFLNKSILHREFFNDGMGIALKYLSLKTATVG